jgi:NADPH:quinone reductase-like Zn-dependent oxidoreductase
MRAIVQDRAGEPLDVLRLVQLPEPPPGAGEIRIRLIAAAVHHGDLYAIRAARIDPEAQPGPLGSEAVGFVDAIGPHVPFREGLEIGARVATFLTPGVWGEQVIAPYERVFVMPDQIRSATASQLLVNSITARMVLRAVDRAIEDAGTHRGVLVQTAAGTAVGRILTSMALDRGLPIINLVRSIAGAASIRQRFPNVPVFSTTDPRWTSHVRDQAGGRPIPAIIDCVGGALIGDLAGLLTDGGAIVTYGGLAPGNLGITGLDLTARELGLRGVSLNRWRETTPADLRQEDVEASIAFGLAHPNHFEVAAEYPLERFGEAITRVERPGRVGLVMLRMING